MITLFENFNRSKYLSEWDKLITPIEKYINKSGIPDYIIENNLWNFNFREWLIESENNNSNTITIAFTLEFQQDDNDDDKEFIMRSLRILNLKEKFDNIISYKFTYSNDPDVGDYKKVLMDLEIEPSIITPYEFNLF
jgi:hypothetical protein